MQLFYSPLLNKEDTNYTFDKEESNHIVKVLRKKNGDNLMVTNGKGYLFNTVINTDNDRKCSVTVVEYDFKEPENFHIHLAVAPTKMNERFEWFLEKATEIGIHEITPIICDHSERKQIKLERFEKIVQAAMKQSLHRYMPILHDAISFKAFIQQENNSHKYIAHCEETEKTLLKNAIPKGASYTLLIGPEGDFSSSEIDSALKANFKPVSLGNTRLRTETAAVVATHSFVFCNEE
ncbi:16S rRNA (uracil(1498)-N(3))-methyltransferase [Myroides guanonis]|uniref:Ribosomal RNA small subunit methyltransferase E n=1 Tax=Myroides guanonis TaxID=1150112 RepID=A0A1I3KYD4_9FLAO|nr:16S rRNA (uracil(1498)-N(3))-methyltransferase [Myroides guanonis]SFI77105.1 16S rRNA (uracil1498-N3)-methyltransferase [Myroides guanonis]